MVPEPQDEVEENGKWFVTMVLKLISKEQIWKLSVVSVTCVYSSQILFYSWPLFLETYFFLKTVHTALYMVGKRDPRQ